MTDTNDPVMDFPCEFPIKAMGRSDAAVAERVVDIVGRHAGEVASDCVTTAYSRSNRFVSVTVTIEAHSREQLDAIYRELTGCRDVLMAL